MKTRTYGWVQNPSSFKNLKKVVQIFDSKSVHYNNLTLKLVPDYIYFEEIKKPLLKKLKNKIQTFTYRELVGRSVDSTGHPPKLRKNAVGDSLIQVSIIPQQTKSNGKKWTDNWTADGFLRWAVSLGFIIPNRETDSYEISEIGRLFSASIDDSDNEKEILRDVLLKYPPATRVLSILNEAPNTMRTKFYIGDRLGFRGEKGFTSYNEDIMFEWLESCSNSNDKRKIKADIEGTSDKYARGICNWLKNVQLVKKGEVIREDSRGGKVSFAGYTITGKGIHALNGKKKEKFIMWEFLATDGENRDYIRTRRAYILKFLKNTNSLDILYEKLKLKGFEDSLEIIRVDIENLNNFGIRISLKDNEVKLKDSFNDFEIPELNLTEVLKNEALEKKKAEFLRTTGLPMKYIELLEIAYDSKRNRDFEIVTSELFKNVYKLNSFHLGGGRKPDGVVFSDKFGIIIDTKAYSKGYPKNISQEDEMIRYIEDNKERSLERNKNEWWGIFDPNIPSDSFYYLWISSRFIGEFHEQLKHTSYVTGVNGGALNVEQLLYGAAKINKGILNPAELPNYLQNEEIFF